MNQKYNELAYTIERLSEYLNKIILEVDCSGRILEVHQNSKFIINLEDDKIIGTSVSDLIVPSPECDSGIDLKNIDINQFNLKKSKPLQAKYLNEDGIEFPISIKLQKKSQHENSIILYAYLNNNDETNEIIKALIDKEVQSKFNELTKNISHEINNPLTIIQGYCSQLELALKNENSLSKEFERYFKKIFININRITEIVKTLRIRN